MAGVEEIAERITLTRTKGSNTWQVKHERFLEETSVTFDVIEGASLIFRGRSGDDAAIGRAIRQLELIVQAGS